MITTILSGCLGADAKLIKVEGKKDFLALSVAVSQRVKDGSKFTTWVHVTYNSKEEGTLINYLKKGTMVLVTGIPYTQVYNNDAQLCVLAKSIELLSSANTEEQPAEEL